MSDFHFETLDGRLVENITVPFSLSVTVTCTKPDCDISMATENVKLVVEFGGIDLAVVTRAWDLADKGRSVSPSLGVGFDGRGSSVKFEVKGEAIVSMIVSCVKFTGKFVFHSFHLNIAIPHTCLLTNKINFRPRFCKPFF